MGVLLLFVLGCASHRTAFGIKGSYC